MFAYMSSNTILCLLPLNAMGCGKDNVWCNKRSTAKGKPFNLICIFLYKCYYPREFPIFSFIVCISRNSKIYALGISNSARPTGNDCSAALSWGPSGGCSGSATCTWSACCSRSSLLCLRSATANV